jgi:hypothetical protein
LVKDLSNFLFHQFFIRFFNDQDQFRFLDRVRKLLEGDPALHDLHPHDSPLRHNEPFRTDNPVSVPAVKIKEPGGGNRGTAHKGEGGESGGGVKSRRTRSVVGVNRIFVSAGKKIQV